MKRFYVDLFTPKVVMVLGGTGSVVFPCLAGLAMQAGQLHLGLGLWVSAAVCAVLGLLAYLSLPHIPDAFEQGDLRARHRGG